MRGPGSRTWKLNETMERLSEALAANEASLKDVSPSKAKKLAKTIEGQKVRMREKKDEMDELKELYADEMKRRSMVIARLTHNLRESKAAVERMRQRRMYQYRGRTRRREISG